MGNKFSSSGFQARKKSQPRPKQIPAPQAPSRNAAYYIKLNLKAARERLANRVADYRTDNLNQELRNEFFAFANLSRPGLACVQQLHAPGDVVSLAGSKKVVRKYLMALRTHAPTFWKMAFGYLIMEWKKRIAEEQEKQKHPQHISVQDTVQRKALLREIELFECLKVSFPKKVKQYLESLLNNDSVTATGMYLAMDKDKSGVVEKHGTVT